MKVILRWAPVAAWCGLIFFFSSLPDLNSGLACDYPLRKLAHMFEYGVLYWLTRRAFAQQGLRESRAAWAAVVFSVLYAMSDEWHQTFVAGRSGVWGDVLFDALGVFIIAGFTCFKQQSAPPNGK